MKRRDVYSFEEAATLAMKALGPSRMAEVSDRSEGAVRAWGDHDCDGRPTIHQALTVDVEMFRAEEQRPFFLEAYMTQLLRETNGLPRGVSDLLSELLDIPEAVGEMVRAARRIKAAQSPGGHAITPAELNELRDCIRRVRQELDDLEAAAEEEGH